jgi:hypothetical protein
MARAQPTCLGNVNDPKNLTRHSERLAKVLNGNVSYGATMQNGQDDINMSVWKAFGTSPGTANTDFTIEHSLGRIPITIVGQDGNNGGLLYRGSSPWTNTTVTLRCTTASMNYNVILA